MKAVSPKSKVYSVNSHIMKREDAQINNIRMHLKVLENKNNPKLVQGIRKIRAEINANRIVYRSIGLKNWLFERLNKIEP